MFQFALSSKEIVKTFKNLGENSIPRKVILNFFVAYLSYARKNATILCFEEMFLFMLIYQNLKTFPQKTQLILFDSKINFKREFEWTCSVQTSLYSIVK